MLQNVAAHNIGVPKRKIFKTQTSHNVQCSTTGKPTRSFATERVSLDSV
jgi:hypothetical protein